MKYVGDVRYIDVDFPITQSVTKHSVNQALAVNNNGEFMCFYFVHIFNTAHKFSFQNSHFTKNITGNIKNIITISHFHFSTDTFIKLI